MELLIGLALAVLCIAIVVYPFVKSRHGTWVDLSEYDGSSGTQDLDAIYERMRILRLEHQLGKISDGMCQEHLRTYRLEAAGIMWRLDQNGMHEFERARNILEQDIRIARGCLSNIYGDSSHSNQCENKAELISGKCPSCEPSAKVSESDLL
jgi:hypothetical protein